MDSNANRKKRLTDGEQRIFRKLREDGSYIATRAPEKLLCDSLVEKGRAVAGDIRRFRWVYKIAEAWKKVPRKLTRNDEKHIRPDPPKKKINRPPAVYSNRSHQEILDHILKNY